MPFNGSGQFNLVYNWEADAAAGINIEASRMDGQEADLASNGFDNCLTRDGQGQATANLPMAGFRHTGVGNGQAATDYAALGQVQNDAGVSWAIAAGSSDAITATYTPALASLVDGQLCFFRATAANSTTTPTFAPNGLTAYTITKEGGVALIAGDIPGNLAECVLRYNLSNTRWELLNPAFGDVNLLVGTTPITGGVSGRIFYDSGGVLALATVTGSLGNVVLSTSPTISGLTVTGSFSATGLVTNADLANSAITIGGVSTALGTSYNPAWGSVAESNATVTPTSSGKMFGFAFAFTPNTTGTLRLSARFDYLNNAGGGNTTWALRYGTGTAPINGATLAGTAADSCSPTLTSSTLTISSNLDAVVTGLSVGTAYWLDMSATATSGTCTVASAALTFQEK